MNQTIRFALVAVLLPGCASAPPASPPSPARPPPSASELFARGMQQAERGDALRAEQYLLLAMRAGYPEPRVIVPLVQVCIASSRLRAALGHAQSFLRRHPETWRLRYLTAAIHLALDRPAAGLVELRHVLRLRPDAAQAHYLMGVAQRDGLRDPEAARASFESYLRQAPRGAHAREALAWLAEHGPAAGHRASGTGAERAAPSPEGTP